MSILEMAFYFSLGISALSLFFVGLMVLISKWLNIPDINDNDISDIE